ncbi:MAG: Gx transporter family protein [Lachnospirales bacterium]
MKIRSLTTIAILVSLSLLLSYIERLIPPIIPLPGIKIGLSNLVIIIVLYLFNVKYCLYISLAKVLLISILFGNFVSLSLSLGGSMLSLLVMYGLKKINIFTEVGVSCAGGVFFNIGQIVIAMIIFSNINLYYYIPILILSGTISGMVIGIVGKMVVERLVYVNKVVQ